MLKAYIHAAAVFTGDHMIEGKAVLVQDGIIVDVVGADAVPADAMMIDVAGRILAPAFIDLQVYGAGGQLFSVEPTITALRSLADHNAAHGTAQCLVTIATQPMHTIRASIAALKAYRKQGGTGIMGMHLEGPFINATKAGAHVKEWIHRPALAEVEALLQEADGVISMVTLAPEEVDEAIIRCFNDHGVIVAAGHSAATFDQAMQAFDHGVSTITHLYNAMSPLHHREPGLVGAAFQHHAVTASIIPDGIHVHHEAVRIAKQLMGDRLFFITDAVTATQQGPYQHQLNDDHYAMPDGTLSGSALTMLQAVSNGVHHCHMQLEEALRMASTYPYQVMRMQDRHGRIQKGHQASMVAISPDLTGAILYS